MSMTMRRVELCTECDDARFPTSNSEAFVNLCEWRDRLMQRFTTPYDRLMAFIHDLDEPLVQITIDGETVRSSDVMELCAGHDGWIVYFADASLIDDACPRCHDDLLVAVRFGNVTFAAFPTVARSG